MKLLFAGICILMLIPGPTSAAFPPMIIKGCLKESNIKLLDLAMFYGTDMAEASKSVTCYLTCLFEAVGFVQNGKVNPDVVELAMNNKDTQSFEAGMIFEMVIACKDLKSEVDCAIGYELLKCFTDYGKNRMFPSENDDPEE